MKLYTRTGDDGTTGLYGGGRVRKDHPRVEAYGDVDELNAAIGVARCALDVMMAGGHKDASRVAQILATIQSRLFDLGADLATPLDSKHGDKAPRIAARDVETVESWIDEIDSRNASLTTFILPGGSEAAARLHLARTVCRRAERRVLTLMGEQSEQVNHETLRYLNRISDLLFAMARRANAIAGVADVEWRSGGA